MPVKILLEIIKKESKSGISICEIGCWDGETTITYMPIIKELKGSATVIDWFKGNIDIDSHHCHGYHPNKRESTKKRFIDNIGETYLPYISIIEGNSQDKQILNKIPEKTFDIVFIDASHKYQDVKNDIINYLPKVKDNGIICGHDCETLRLVNSFTREELEQDYVLKNHLGFKQKVHAGVIQAVYDVFGIDVEILDDLPGGSDAPIWVKRVKRNQNDHFKQTRPY